MTAARCCSRSRPAVRRCCANYRCTTGRNYARLVRRWSLLSGEQCEELETPTATMLRLPLGRGDVLPHNMSDENHRDGHDGAKAPGVREGGAFLPLGTDGARPLSSIAGSKPAQFRIVLVSFLAGGIGLIAGLVAFLLYKLIGLFTNLVFFHRWDATFVSARLNHLGPWVILMPVLGGIVVGIMAKYGTPK